MHSKVIVINAGKQLVVFIPLSMKESLHTLKPHTCSGCSNTANTLTKLSITLQVALQGLIGIVDNDQQSTKSANPSLPNTTIADHISISSAISSESEWLDTSDAGPSTSSGLNSITQQINGIPGAQIQKHILHAEAQAKWFAVLADETVKKVVYDQTTIKGKNIHFAHFD
ncbi:hypothetical protein H0H87_000825 [Tephrocybe sp. NHM501043]|nr:hypothetical protein H0H87_000825 [Tephrocybe sp. NHM501043]